MIPNEIDWNKNMCNSNHIQHCTMSLSDINWGRGKMTKLNGNASPNTNGDKYFLLFGSMIPDYVLFPSHSTQSTHTQHSVFNVQCFHASRALQDVSKFKINSKHLRLHFLFSSYSSFFFLISDDIMHVSIWRNSTINSKWRRIRKI